MWAVTVDKLPRGSKAKRGHTADDQRKKTKHSNFAVGKIWTGSYMKSSNEIDSKCGNVQVKQDGPIFRFNRNRLDFLRIYLDI